jgi:hypothetical protein
MKITCEAYEEALISVAMMSGWKEKEFRYLLSDPGCVLPKLSVDVAAWAFVYNTGGYQAELIKEYLRELKEKGFVKFE